MRRHCRLIAEMDGDLLKPADERRQMSNIKPSMVQVCVHLITAVHGVPRCAASRHAHVLNFCR